MNAPLARITPEGVLWKERRPLPDVPLELLTGLERRVCVLKLVPGTSPSLLDMMVDAGYRGIIIEGFGAGGVPNDSRGSFLPSIRRAVEMGVIDPFAPRSVFSTAWIFPVIP